MGACVLCRFCCRSPCSANVSPDVQRVQGLLRMVEAAKPIQKLGTPCQSCGLKALTNLRCSRWSAAALTRAPRCRQAQQNPSLTPCRGSKLVNYCSADCQLRGPPPPPPPSSCAEVLSLNL